MRIVAAILFFLACGLLPAQDSLYFKTGEAIAIRSFTLNPASITYLSNADAVLEYSKTLIVKLRHGDSLIDFAAIVPKSLRTIEEDSEDFVKSCRHNARGQLSASEMEAARYIYTNDPNTADQLYREIKKTRSKRTLTTVFGLLAIPYIPLGIEASQSGTGLAIAGYALVNTAAALATLSVLNLVSKYRHKKHIKAIIHHYTIPAS